MSATMIAAKGLTKRFGTLTAVDHLELTVGSGEVVGFLGPNGAGKTTTIRMLLGFVRPTAGDSAVMGVRLSRDPHARRRVGYLPGDLRVEPTMTGNELLAYVGGLRGGLNRAKADELAQRLNLDLTRRFHTLSKGNRQKVGIVQAFCHDPEVLILDEPTTGLDPLIQREFLTLVREAAARGAAVLFSSHVLPEVERIASTVAIIRSGRLVRRATVDELLDSARRTMELRFAEPVPVGLFDHVAGVIHADYDGRSVTVTLDGAIGPAMSQATSSGTLLRADPVSDDLENLFLSLYEHTERNREAD